MAGVGAGLRTAVQHSMRADHPSSAIAVEWLLDNQHVALQAVDQVTMDIPAGFYRRLPKVLDEGEARARIEALASEYLAACEGLIDVRRALEFVRGFQSVTPLDIGELWAFPSFLRLLVAEEVVDAARGATAPVPATTVNERMAAAISSLRVLDAADWKEFFESVSVVDRYLRLDPNDTYASLDFDTRNSYRDAVEEMARWGPSSEAGVARSAIEAVGERGQPLGALLTGAARRGFEVHLECRVPAPIRLRRFVGRHAGLWYFGGAALSTAAAMLLLLFPLVAAYPAIPLLAAIGAGALALVPATSMALAVVNGLAARIAKPRRLPRLDFSEGIPDEARTLIAVAALLTDVQEVQALLRQLELNHRGNLDANLPIALVADPVDADRRVLAEDARLEAVASAGIRDLNRRYRGSDGRDPFLLLSRDRSWNPAEGRWMAWERKRGKLHELNRLLLGHGDSGVRVLEGDPAALAGVKYVLTLDADTFLPQGAAARLIGALAHPLNAPRFDARGRVEQGYTVLQPRVETVADSVRPTRFSRIFAAGDGFDLYSHAASDVYQDLFAEGVFVGKGLYHVEAFERSLEGRVPENALLSHDLFEGVHGRAALVTDVAVVEHHPSHPTAYMRRLHRWVRGDWQISPWLARNVPVSGGRRRRNDLPALARWKIVDNLRRSLLGMSLLLLTVVGWWWLPNTVWWSVVPFVVLGVPVLAPAVISAANPWRAPRAETVFRTSANRIGWAVLRWWAEFVFLPWRAAVEADAVVRTVYRVLVSRSLLLQWTPAAATARSVTGERPVLSRALEWAPVCAIPLAIGAGGALLGRLAWPSQAPLLLTWCLAPALAWVLAVGSPRRRDLSEDELRWLRRLARRTWAYFDRYVNAEHHWLPPDNVQLRPVAAVAERTSPTNIGFGLLAQLVGSDRGFVPPSHLAATLASTLDTIDRLEKHRGHLLNWYDTRLLRPLPPSYVSSVDSGNLAACAIAVAEGLRDVSSRRLPCPAHADGMVDGLEVLAETLETFRTVGPFHAGRLPAVIRTVAREFEEVRMDGGAFAERLAAFVNAELPTIEAEIAQALESRPREDEDRPLGSVREWVRGLDRQAMAVHGELELLVPWLGAISAPPRLFAEMDGHEAEGAWRDLVSGAPPTPRLRELPGACEEVLRNLEALRHDPAVARAPPDVAGEALGWIANLADRVHTAKAGAVALLTELNTLRHRLLTLAWGMDFRFLYDPARKLLRVGYHVGAGTPDPSYYDLFASEARLASFIAIAKGDAPVEHWMHLGRPFARRQGRTVLLSWAGTMFEYLMPGLFLREPPESLADVASHRAVDVQIGHGQAYRLPWGMSESGFHETDARGHYRYRAFGVGALGVRRDPADRIVVAPYATVLALQREPRRAVRNLRRLEGLGVGGSLGFHEAADFGARGALRSPHVVHSYMAHHQGMALAALDNFLTDSVLVERFQRDAHIATFEYLLHEASPTRVRAQSPIVPPSGGDDVRVSSLPTVPTWTVDPHAFPTPATVVSNGALSSLLTARGSGGLRWRGRDLLRWRPDPTAQAWGTWIYVRDVESDRLWSATLAPTWVEPERYEVVFGAESVEYRRKDHGITMRTTVTVATSVDVEIRQVRIVNETDRPRTLELTSYAEVALAAPAEDRRHQAFSKLFVEGRYAATAGTLLLERRIRGDEPPAYLAHAIGSADPGDVPLAWQLSRESFLGRGGDLASPRGARSPAPGGPAEPWAPLDPIISLTARVVVPPGGDVSLSFLTAIADAPGTALAALDTFRSPDQASFAVNRSRDRVRALLHELSVDGALLPDFQRLLTAVVFPYHDLRLPPPAAVPGSLPGQQSLWAAGVSGDLPIVLVEAGVGDVLLEQVLKAHAYWAREGARFDLVFAGNVADGYDQPLHGQLARVLRALGLEDRFDLPGGVHLMAFGRFSEAVLASVRASASLVLVEDGRTLSEHLSALEHATRRAPPFVPVASTNAPFPPEISALARPEDLRFDNGFGGFSPAGDEYVVHLEPGQLCPAPWTNVVANEGFGFLVSESGGGFTWLGNSGERRLTEWRNDPVGDVPSEVLYLRDEETGAIWSATPAPAPAPAPYQVVHRAGSTTFLHRSHGLGQRLELFPVPDEPLKVAELTLENAWDRPRRITATYFAEWALGAGRSSTGPHIITEVSHTDRAIIAWNPFSPAAEALVAFLGASEPIHSFTCDRTEFLGQEGHYLRPAGLTRIGLEGSFGAALDPCAALQVHLDLDRGESRTIRFVLGAAGLSEDVSALLQRVRDPAATPRLHRRAPERWLKLLDRISVKTPDSAMDLLLNGWLLYQTISCRLWGRSGLYQSSGAFGFRDQLQDSLALRLVAPELTRRQILEAGRHQFTEGDVLHWWHPEDDRGVRTRCSDDLLWLPFAVAEYVEATGDLALLDEPVAFLEGPTLGPDELERYDTFGTTEPGPLYEHCIAALEHASARSGRGLPLIGTGDWNDAMNRVGPEGRGESIWLAWFLYAVETRFAEIAERRGDSTRAADLRSDAELLRAAVEANAWDGAWYQRATYDDGSPIGTSTAAEGRIDSLTQSWAVLSGGAEPERAGVAMASVSEQLIRRDERLVLLLTPPFHATRADPGYIRAYPPGVRENGGQYTHAATWVGLAFAAMGDGERAAEVFGLLNPILHAPDPEGARAYRVEPYVVAGDVYGSPPHTGRGGWTWYTGSAAWLYRLGMEGVLGLRPAPEGLEIRPRIPPSWDGYEAHVRVGGETTYRIVVRNPHGTTVGPVSLQLDGRPIEGSVVPLDDDGRRHEVQADVGLPSST